ncbi:MAG: hypothetical protein PVG14_08340 [Anaerolineales bacterium]
MQHWPHRPGVSLLDALCAVAGGQAVLPQRAPGPNGGTHYNLSFWTHIVQCVYTYRLPVGRTYVQHWPGQSVPYSRGRCAVLWG